MKSRFSRFFIKSAFDRLYTFQDQILHFNHVLVSSLKLVWILNDPSNVQVFGWRLLHHRLQMRDELENWWVISGVHNLVCPLCLSPEETYLHFFIVFRVSTKVWSYILDWFGVNALSSILSIFYHLLLFESLMRRRAKKTYMILICLSFVRAIWLIPNDILLKGRVKRSRYIVLVAISLA